MFTIIMYYVSLSLGDEKRNANDAGAHFNGRVNRY